jgi:uncharacterized alpha-E superfamily protein
VFQLAALDAHVVHLPSSARAARAGEERIALGALTRARIAEVNELCRVEEGKRLRLSALLGRTQDDLRAFSDALTQSYLSHAGEARRIETF